MAVIYMLHPVHGAKVAISEQEAIFDEIHGWSVYNPETPDAADADDASNVVNEMAAPKRRGRPRTKQED